MVCKKRLQLLREAEDYLEYQSDDEAAALIRKLSQGLREAINELSVMQGRD